MINISEMIKEKEIIEKDLFKVKEYLDVIRISKYDKSFIYYNLIFIFSNISFFVYNYLTLENKSGYLTGSFILSCSVYYLIVYLFVEELLKSQNKIINEHGYKLFFKIKYIKKEIESIVFCSSLFIGLFCVLINADINIILIILSLMMLNSIIRFFLFHDFIVKKFIKRKKIINNLKISYKDLITRKENIKAKEINIIEDEKLMSEIYGNIENDKYNESEMFYISNLVSLFQDRKENKTILKIKKESLKNKIKDTYGEDFKIIKNINKELLKVENN